MKTEYINEARELIQNNFSPVLSLFDENEYTVKKSLAEVYKDVTNILPGEWIYQSDIYEILRDLGFKSFLYTKEANDEYPEKTFLVYFMDRKTAAL